MKYELQLDSRSRPCVTTDTLHEVSCRLRASCPGTKLVMLLLYLVGRVLDKGNTVRALEVVSHVTHVEYNLTTMLQEVLMSSNLFSKKKLSCKLCLLLRLFSILNYWYHQVSTIAALFLGFIGLLTSFNKTKKRHHKFQDLLYLLQNN